MLSFIWYVVAVLVLIIDTIKYNLYYVFMTMVLIVCKCLPEFDDSVDSWAFNAECAIR